MLSANLKINSECDAAQEFKDFSASDTLSTPSVDLCHDSDSLALHSRPLSVSRYEMANEYISQDDRNVASDTLVDVQKSLWMSAQAMKSGFVDIWHAIKILSLHYFKSIQKKCDKSPGFCGFLFTTIILSVIPLIFFSVYFTFTMIASIGTAAIGVFVVEFGFITFALAFLVPIELLVLMTACCVGLIFKYTPPYVVDMIFEKFASIMRVTPFLKIMVSNQVTEHEERGRSRVANNRPRYPPKFCTIDEMGLSETFQSEKVKNKRRHHLD
ncbi:hypothetical protein HK096_008194 [Nowakowskiella sp. JEL0078]|nr:hypothetical protein HK096_008194 [Nowakowskiella sp. JEL0078]